MSTDKLPVHLESRKTLDKASRLSSPSAERNHAVIGAELSRLLPQGAHILEIASGTGQHAAHMCKTRPDIIWQPSDPHAESRASQNAWRLDVPDQMRPSLYIDTTHVDWAAKSPAYDAIFCANMIHIAPWEAALGLVQAAHYLVREGGLVVLYGPFQDGAQTAESNLDFDRSLKSRDPRWGVRDLASVKHIFAKAGFNSATRIDMPKNNLMMVFKRSAP